MNQTTSTTHGYPTSWISSTTTISSGSITWSQTLNPVNIPKYNWVFEGERKDEIIEF